MNQAEKFINEVKKKILLEEYPSKYYVIKGNKKLLKMLDNQISSGNVRVNNGTVLNKYVFSDGSILEHRLKTEWSYATIQLISNTEVRQIQCMITEECFIPFSQMQSIRAGLRKTLSDINKRRIELERDIRVFYARAEDDGTPEGAQFFTLLNEARVELEAIKKAESNNIILTKMVKACMMDASRSRYIV